MFRIGQQSLWSLYVISAQRVHWNLSWPRGNSRRLRDACHDLEEGKLPHSMILLHRSEPSLMHRRSPRDHITISTVDLALHNDGHPTRVSSKAEKLTLVKISEYDYTLSCIIASVCCSLERPPLSVPCSMYLPISTKN